MGRLSKLLTVAEIADKVAGMYDLYAQRKLQRQDHEKDARIRELEAEVERLKEEK